MFPQLSPVRAARLLLQARARVLGGPGSGNFGHAGRPGEVGGSASSETAESLDLNKYARESVESVRKAGNYELTLKKRHEGWGETRYEYSIEPKRSERIAEAKTGFEGKYTTYYDPELAEVGPSAYMEGTQEVRLKPGIVDELEATEPGYLYRGMSYGEWQAIKREGRIESKGEYNLGPEQVGETYFSTDIEQAAHYASGFAPWQYKPTFDRPAVVVKIKDPGTGRALNTTERGLRGSIPLSDVVSVFEAKPYAIKPGEVEFYKDFQSGGKYTEGSRHSPSVSIIWKRRGSKTLGGPGSGNFGHAGRPGQIGGSASKQDQGDADSGNLLPVPALVAYHGTTDQAWRAIQKEGLVPHRGKGADVIAGAPQYVIGAPGSPRRASVYISDDPRIAASFADFVARKQGMEALILEIRIPKDQAWKVVSDTQLETGLRFNGTIPPEWIRRTDLPVDELKRPMFMLAEENKDIVVYAVVAVRKRRLVTAGGPGSGNFGHAGRPGEVGGSASTHQGATVAHIGVPSGIDDAIQKADGGFTYHAVTGKVPKTGYALSLHQDREQILDAKDVNVVTLAAYVKKNRELLSQPNNYFGGWHNPEDDKVYLDVSTVVDSPEEAERLGTLAKQYAYYDLASGKSVKIEGRRYALPKTAAAFVGSYRGQIRGAYARRYYRARSSFDGARTDARGNRTGTQNTWRIAGGPGSGNFGHAGRPGEIGGSSKTVYHGTAESNLQTILKEGLLKKHAGRVWDIAKPGHVFVTTNFESAKQFAQTAADRLSGGGFIATPAVLKIEVPEEISETFNPDAWVKKQGEAFEFAGDIPPDWIKGAWTREGPFKHDWDNPEPWVKVLAGNRTFYIAVVLKQKPRNLGGPGSGNFGHAGRPGEVGGSAPSGGAATDTGIRQNTPASEMRAKAQPANLQAAEDRIRHEAHEHGYTFTESGAVLYDGQDMPNGVQLQNIPERELGTLSDPYLNAVFTHNHPGGSGLSPNDIFAAASHNMREVRAVGSDGYVYSAERVGDRWPDPHTLVGLASGIDKEVHREFVQQIHDGKLTVRQAEQTHWPEVWKRVARVANLIETRIKFFTDKVA